MLPSYPVVEPIKSPVRDAAAGHVGYTELAIVSKFKTLCDEYAYTIACAMLAAQLKHCTVSIQPLEYKTCTSKID
jgi:hypothetical protein